MSDESQTRIKGVPGSLATLNVESDHVLVTSDDIVQLGTEGAIGRRCESAEEAQHLIDALYSPVRALRPGTCQTTSG